MEKLRPEEIEAKRKKKREAEDSRGTGIGRNSAGNAPVNSAVKPSYEPPKKERVTGLDLYVSHRLNQSGNRAMSGRDKYVGAVYQDGPLKGMSEGQAIVRFRQEYANGYGRAFEKEARRVNASNGWSNAPAQTPAQSPVQTPAQSPVQTPAQSPVQTPGGQSQQGQGTAHVKLSNTGDVVQWRSPEREPGSAEFTLPNGEKLSVGAKQNAQEVAADARDKYMAEKKGPASSAGPTASSVKPSNKFYESAGRVPKDSAALNVMYSKGMEQAKSDFIKQFGGNPAPSPVSPAIKGESSAERSLPVPTTTKAKTVEGVRHGAVTTNDTGAVLEMNENHARGLDAYASSNTDSNGVRPDQPGYTNKKKKPAVSAAM